MTLASRWSVKDSLFFLLYMILSVFEVIHMYCRINLGWIRPDPPMELLEKFKHLKELLHWSQKFQDLVFSTIMQKKTKTYCSCTRFNLYWFAQTHMMRLFQVDDEGEVFHSLDDGQTRFTDLIQLVEFYQLNRGVLPCKLKHHCAWTLFTTSQTPVRHHEHPDLRFWTKTRSGLVP